MFYSHFKPRLENKLKRMDEIRVWLDPRPSKDEIERELLHLPNAENIFFQMSGTSFLQN